MGFRWAEAAAADEELIMAAAARTRLTLGIMNGLGYGSGAKVNRVE